MDKDKKIIELTRQLEELGVHMPSEDSSMKGLVGIPKEEKEEENLSSDGLCFEVGNAGLNCYRDYSKEGHNSKLKRLIRR